MQSFRLRSVVLPALGLLVASSVTSADDFSFESLQGSIRDTIDAARPASVRITGRGSSFSGVIVSAQGHVLSVAHAVTPGTKYQVTLPDGRRFRGTGKGSNARTDSALIMISDPGDDLPYAPMGDSSTLVANQPCLGISYPGGQKVGTDPVIRFGRIVRTGRSRSRGGMLQSSALMEPGDSGGPLFDLNGCVIGIHSRIGSAMDRNYEVPVNVYRDFWNELNRESDFEQAGVPTPRLGVVCTNSEDGGLRIRSVVDNSLASKAGIEEDDTVLQLNGSDLSSIDDLRKALIAARDAGLSVLKISLLRGEETIELEAEYDIPRKAAPKVELPTGDRPSVPKPQGFRELSSLAEQLTDLESKLDDACIQVVSDFGDEDVRSIVGVRIRNTRWVISKSSVVGDKPQFEVDEEKFPLKIVQRAAENDLVLMEAEAIHEVGVELPTDAVELEIGTFLLSPDDSSAGEVSILSIPAFQSRKQQSRGYLGVTPSTYQKDQGARLDRVLDDGAASKAGLMVGDVVTKLNDKTIRNQTDMRSFLMQKLPNAVISTTLLRGEEEITVSIKLGAPASGSNHAADRMDKSDRRDGFRQVYSHDADLAPEECGGPLFDLNGRFVGLNIARNSRVRCFAVPASEIIELIPRGELTDESKPE